MNNKYIVKYDTELCRLLEELNLCNQECGLHWITNKKNYLYHYCFISKGRLRNIGLWLTNDVKGVKDDF